MNSMKKFAVSEIPPFRGGKPRSNEFSYEEDDEDDDDEEDDNQNNVREVFNDETSLASTISSTSSATSQLSNDLNLLVEIGLENANKNKDILHELSLTMKNMPAISLDSESMNRGSFMKSVTFAEEDDILEFDYKQDMIFPDYETPIKDRSKLLGSALENDEDHDKLKIITDYNNNIHNDISTNEFDNINEDGITGQHTNSKILNYNDINDNENNENNDIEIENTNANVQDSNDRIKAALNELKLQLIHELCPVNEWISHKSDLLIAKMENTSTVNNNNNNNLKVKEKTIEKKKKKKTSFVAFDVDSVTINNDNSKTNNIKINDNVNVAIINEDAQIEQTAILPPNTEKTKKKKKGISFRMDSDDAINIIPNVNFPIPLIISESIALKSAESSPTLSHKAISPPKHVTVIGSLRTEALAVPRDIIESHVAPPSDCITGSILDLQSQEIRKLQQQSINGSVFVPFDPKTTKIRLTLSISASLDFCTVLPRTVQYKRCDGLKVSSIYHHDPADQEFYNRSLIKSRSSNLAHELMSHFLQKQAMGFICILIDRNLQVIGSYDDAIGNVEDEESEKTGLVFGPSFYRIPTHKQQRQCLLKANLVELELKNLPEDVFAIVPIAYDECLKGLSEISIDNIQGTSSLSFEFYSIKEDRYFPESMLSSSDEIASKSDGFSGIGGFKFTKQSSTSKEVLEEITSVGCQRNLKKVINRYQNDDAVIGLGQGIIPSIIFRTGTEDAWAMKSIKKVVNANELDMLYGQVLNTMIEQNIIPFHFAHIEHCYNCAEHQMSTRHEPGSYEAKFKQLQEDILLQYPPIIFVANHKDISPKPRLGSFEFSFQSYGEDASNLVFSKLKKGDFPSMDNISTELDTILNLDNSLRFGRGHVPKFKIALVDAYNKKPVRSAVLSLYRLCNKVTGSDCFKKNGNRASPKRSMILNDAEIRHTEAYAHVRSWGKEDIIKWFLSAGASEESAKNAIYAGVIDGTSLLKLVDSTSLKKWGVLNRRHLKKLEDFLISIKGDKKSDGFSDSQTQVVLQDKQCALILQQAADDNGICSFNIDISGSYYVKVDAPNYESYFTHSLLVDSVQKFLYSAVLQPKLIHIKVAIDIAVSDSKWINIILAGRGLTQSLYNLESGKRHFVRIKIPTNLLENKMATEMSRIFDSVDSSNNDNGGTTKKEAYFKVNASIYLPLGIYFNEVNGTVLNLYKDDNDNNDDTNNNNDEDDYDNYIIPPKIDKKKDMRIHFESRQSTRCHNRLLVKAVRKFQRLYRHYYLKQREWLYATIMRCQLKLMRSLRRARDRISMRKAVIIQTCFRRYRQELKYNIFLNGLILSQSIYRGNLGRKRVSNMIVASTIVSQWIIAWILYLRRKAVIRVKKEQHRIEEEIRRVEEERREVERIRILKIEKEMRNQEKREREELERLEKSFEEKVLQDKERQEKEDQKEKGKTSPTSRSIFKGGGNSGKKENVLAGAAKAVVASPTNEITSSERLGSPIILMSGYSSSLKTGSPTTSSPTISSPTTSSPTTSSPKTNNSPSKVAGSNESQKSKSKNIGHIRNKFKKLAVKVDNVVTDIASIVDDENANTIEIQNASHSYALGADVSSIVVDKNANTIEIPNANTINYDDNHLSIKDTVVSNFVEPDYMKDDFIVKTTPIKELEAHKVTDASNACVAFEDAGTQMTPLPKEDATPKIFTPLTEYQISGYIYDNSGNNHSPVDTSTLGGEDEYLSRVLPDRLKRIATMSPMKIIKDSSKIAHHHIKTQTSALVNTLKSSDTIKKLILKTTELRERVPRGIQELRKYLNRKNIIRDKAATLIQAMVRGAQCRNSIFQEKNYEFFIDTFYPSDEFEDDDAIDSKIDANSLTILPIDRPRFRPNLSIIIDGSDSNSSSQSIDIKVVPSDTPKTPLAKLQNALSTSVRIASEKSGPIAHNLEKISKMIKKDLNIAKEITSIKGQALIKKISSKISAGSNAAMNATQEYLINKQSALERKIRSETSQFSSSDALLNVHGSFMDIPTINAHFYIAIYPQTSDDVTNFGIDDVIEKVDEVTGIKVKIYPFRAKRDRTIERHSNKEGVQSTYLYPFSPEQFMMTSFNCHLTDVSRYITAEIVIYVEAEYFGMTKPENPYVHQGNSMIEGIPPATEEDKTTGAGLRRFVPAFFGDVNIGRGGIFGPQGGRMHVSLTADQEMITQLAKHPKLSTLKSLDVIVTILPVSIPSSTFLHTFRSIDRINPCYPSFLVDAELLEHKEVEIDRDTIGATTSIGAFGDRIFVSARNRGIPCGVIEYNNEGKIVKKLCDAEQLGIITSIICGHNHIACCGSNGNILFLYEGKVSTAIKSSLVESHPGRLLISFGCVIAHGGIDIFFTGDKSGNICVSFMDNGKCLRQYLNNNFIGSKITSMNVYGSRLYISQHDGTLTVVNIQPIFQGFYESAGQLKNLVKLEESIFSNESGGIVCSAVASPNGYLGIKDEDEVTKDIEGVIKAKKNTPGAQYCADVVEGHILLLGGGDASPHIAILQPFTSQSESRTSFMREIATLLNAHEMAVTQIVIDAAGRHIFSASAGAKQIKIWDGLSFTVERQIDDINVTCMSLSPNCFLVGSVRAPFFRMWKSKYNKQPSNAISLVMAKSPSNSNNFSNTNNENVSDIGIVTYRSPRWCTSVLLGKTPPIKSLVKAITTDDDTLSVINRWTHQYVRPDDDYSIKRKVPSFSGKATPRRIKNSETPRHRARRQFEKTLLSPEKDNIPPPRPHRLKRVNEIKKDETSVIENIVSNDEIKTNETSSDIKKIIIRKNRKLHFSDSEDDNETDSFLQ